MSDDRRSNDTPWGDTARILAILYIVGFLGMVAALFLYEIPTGNRELILTLAGIMSTVQAAIIGWYFGGSKTGEAAQRTLAVSKERADSTLQELAKAPVVAATVAAAAGTSGEPMPVKIVEGAGTEGGEPLNVKEQPK